VGADEGGRGGDLLRVLRAGLGELVRKAVPAPQRQGDSAVLNVFVSEVGFYFADHDARPDVAQQVPCDAPQVGAVTGSTRAPILTPDIDAVMHFLVVGVDEEGRHREAQDANHTPQL
jgi:hypothetical protein